MSHLSRPHLTLAALSVLAMTLVLALALLRSGGGRAEAASPPSGFTESQIASGLSSPTAMAFAPDGRLFVAEQGGRLRVIKNGTLLAAPFVTLTVDDAGERGLLGVAFDPSFASNRFVYVYYTTAAAPVHNRLSRFTATGDVAVAGSETVLLDLDNLSSATNHNGGAIHFGPDGKLYVAVGENATGANSQTLTNLLGKLLRLNPDGSIPTDNPFVSRAGARGEIWALGLRNPFTFAFQRGTGRLFINDVGQNAWEEINDGQQGANYGWPTTEGYTTDSRFVSPLFAYDHTIGATGGCAITGGAFYNPPTVQFPASYVGKYFFADYCSGWLRTYDPGTDTASAFAAGYSAPVDLAVSDDGSLYVLAIDAGAVYRISASSGQAPAITTQPQSQTVAVGGSATFSCSAAGSAPLAYRWQRNGADLSGATSPSYTRSNVTTADNGAQFRCLVTNSFGAATSTAATLTVTTNQPPTATITSPAAGTTYRGGDPITYSGTGSDPEDGPLGAAAFSWRVDFHHDTHSHPFLPDTTGRTSGTFTIPTTGHTETTVWYRIILTVRDSAGLTSTTTRDIQPVLATINLATSPAGLQVTLDGQPQSTPLAVRSVVGVERTLGAVSPQSSGGTRYAFAAWSDGGAATHPISTPAAATTYTARYTVASSQTVTFDDKAGQDQALTGQYPSNLIDWGTGRWYHSGPWGKLPTKSISFAGSGVTSASFTFVSPRILVSLDAYNGGGASTTVTLACAGQSSKSATLASGQLTTISTGWTGTCTTVTVSSTNGWDTNFDSLVHDGGPPPDTTPPTISAVQASGVTSSGATVTWTTNEPADTQVEYSTTTSYGSSTTLNGSMVTSHSQALSGLTPNTTYHYRVKSKDAAGNPATSGDFTFTTMPPASSQTVTFDDKSGQDQALTGQYPSGVIDWGSGTWYHSGPWGKFTTKSISFAGSGVTSAGFTFVAPRRLVSLQAYNGGSGSTTVTLKCAGQPDKSVTLAAGQLTTISTGWAGTCTTVTVSSTNGWDTNFDSLIIQ